MKSSSHGVSAKHMLTQRKLRKTPARLAVLEAFLKAQQPLGAQEVAEKVTSADTATVYRTLQTLLDEGVLRMVNLRHDHIDYELSDDNDHHHLICTKCGLVENFEGCNEEKLVAVALAKSKQFAVINEHAIELFGLCKNCSLAKSSKSKA